jgi:hypothetical protein
VIAENEVSIRAGISADRQTGREVIGRIDADHVTNVPFVPLHSAR